MTTDMTRQARPGRTYLNVPLCTGEAGRWPDGMTQHYIEAVNLPCHPEPGIAEFDGETHSEEFAAALAAGASLTLIGTGEKELLSRQKGVVNRPLFGLLLGAGDLLARSHPGHGVMRWVALVKRAEPNTGWVFKQAGIGIEFTGKPNYKGGPAVPERPFPSSKEDLSIMRWWREHPRQGLLLAEVTVGRGGPGGWSDEGSSRAIDAIHFPDREDQRAEVWSGDADELAALVENSEVEIVEAKKKMTFDVIGQCLAGAVMFARSYPTHGRVTAVAVVRGSHDVALDWVCHRRGIEVVRYTEEEIAA